MLVCIFSSAIRHFHRSKLMVDWMHNGLVVLLGPLKVFQLCSEVDDKCTHILLFRG